MYKNKNKDMSRSVLPSTRRRQAKLERRSIHHSARQHVRSALHRWDEDYDDEDIYLDPQRGPVSGGGYYTKNIKDMVFARREADKLGPLMRWARDKADDFGDNPGERYAKLRSILPDGIIGWHAMTHVDFLDAYDKDPRFGGLYYRDGLSNKDWKAKQDAEWVVKAEAVAEVIKGRGMHKAFNARVKGIIPEGHTRQKIVGWKIPAAGEKLYYYQAAIYDTEYYTCSRCHSGTIPLKGWSHVNEWLAEVRSTCKSHEYIAAFEKFYKEHCV